MRIAVIGGGLIGSYVAWQLAEKGNKVTIFEQNTRPGKQACSGLISERIWNFIPINEELILHKVDASILNVGSNSTKLNFKPQMLVFNRPQLDRYVLGLALDAGVRFVIEKIDDLPRNFDYVIGCDGALSTTRRKLKLKDPKFRMGILCRVESKNKLNSDFVETWPLEKGFAWKIPRGNEIEYGVLAPLEKAKEEFLHFCIKQNIRPAKQHASLVPQGLVFSTHPRVALCGDAAGLTKPWSGGGVIWGLSAAEILVETFPDLGAYNRSLKRFFKSKYLLATFATTFGYLAAKHFPNVLPNERSMDSDFFPFKF